MTLLSSSSSSTVSSSCTPCTLSLGKLCNSNTTTTTNSTTTTTTTTNPTTTNCTPTTPLSTNVHLVALLSILDHWNHRNIDSNRVVGVLLGTKDTNNSIHITDAFPIALLDNDTSIDVDFASTMYALRRRTNANELVLGWYSTGNELLDSTTGFHNWFEDNLLTPLSNTTITTTTTTVMNTSTNSSAIHLLVDTSLTNNDMSIRSFIGAPVASLTDGPQGRMFIPLPTIVSPADYELSALETIATAALPSNNNLAQIEPRVGIPQAHGRIAKLESLIDGCIGLVQDIIDDEQQSSTSTTISLSQQQQQRKLQLLGHALRNIVQTRTHGHDVKVIDTEIRDIKTIMELATQARKQIQLTELIMYGAAYKH